MAKNHEEKIFADKPHESAQMRTDGLFAAGQSGTNRDKRQNDPASKGPKGRKGKFPIPRKGATKPQQAPNV
jgi:hypothetical protein